MKIPTKTIKVRKSTVYIIILLIVFNGTALMLLGAFGGNGGEPAADLSGDYSDMRLIQLEPPPEGAPRAVISTSEGDFTAVLYPDEAPNAVKRFLSDAEKGSLNGLKAELYESGGVFAVDSPNNEDYAIEPHKNLWPFRGALCMNKNGDIIFAGTVDISEEDRELLLSDESELKAVSAAFAEKGGIPDFSRIYTVFGQVTEGMDTIDKITSAPTDRQITVISVSAAE